LWCWPSEELRATAIPTLAIPISIIGALTVVYFAGFTINIHTAGAGPPSSGDDAIVVPEKSIATYGDRCGCLDGSGDRFAAATTITPGGLVPPAFDGIGDVCSTSSGSPLLRY
jgi:hypothetical protein